MEYEPLAADAPFYNASRQSPDILQFHHEEGIDGFQASAARPLSPSPLTLETGQFKDEDMDTTIANDESEEASIPFDLIEGVNWKLEVCSSLQPLSG